MSKLSVAVKNATAYRKVMGRIVSFANNELKTLYPNKTYSERIIMAHEYPFWDAAKELRELTKEEKTKIGLIQPQKEEGE